MHLARVVPPHDMHLARVHQCTTQPLSLHLPFTTMTDTQPNTPSDTPTLDHLLVGSTTDPDSAKDDKDDVKESCVALGEHGVASVPSTSHSDVPDDDTMTRIDLVCNYLKESSLYAPLQSTRQLVTWKPENRSHRLVVKDTDQPAVMTVIAIISSDSFFLTPDAYYKGGNNITPSLADVKLTCIARRPVEANIATDFVSALANVLWLMEQVRSPGVPRVGVTLPSGSVIPTSFKFRHVLFKVSFADCRLQSIDQLRQEVGSEDVIMPIGTDAQSTSQPSTKTYFQAHRPHFTSLTGP